MSPRPPQKLLASLRHPVTRDTLITLIVLGGIAAFFLMRPSPSAPRRPGPPVAGNAYKLIESLTDPALDLNGRLARLPKVMTFAEYSPPSHSPPIVPNFLEHQVLSKVARVDADFDLLQGNRSEALAQLAALYYVGQLLQQHHMTISVLMGVAIQAISLGGLETAALNISETTAGRQLVWNTLDDLDARTRVPTRRLVAATAPLMHRLFLRDTIDEAFARQQTVYVKLRLLRAAVAALDRLASSGSFPRTAAEFAPLLPDGPEEDQFRKTPGPLEFGLSGKDFRLWSFGPDQISQGGSVQYDPTNGTFSVGDLIVDVLHDRTYPFPTSGTAVTASDIHAQFPHGLPQDSFADIKKHGYSISTTSPVTVYSFGPDTDQHGRTTAGVPEVQYDPTNGTVSEGDLLLVLPTN